MWAAGRLWVLGGAAVLLGAIAFTLVRTGADDSAAPTTTRTAPAPDRSLAAARYGANVAGAPEVVRVARDDAVWALVREGGHTRLARLDGRSLREIPLGDA